MRMRTKELGVSQEQHPAESERNVPMQALEIPAQPDEESTMMDKTIRAIPMFCTRYTMFWALYVISIILMTTGLIIEIYAGDLFTSTIMLISLVVYLAFATLVFRR